MSAGRKPKPTQIKLLAGNPGKRPLNKREPKPESGIPPCPKVLQGEARREWRRTSKQLCDIGVLTKIDRAALAAYCQAWSRWVEAEGKIRELGMVIATPNNFLAQNPYLAIANRAMELMMRLLVEFGMTPSSRSRIAAAPIEKQDDEDRFFSGPRPA